MLRGQLIGRAEVLGSTASVGAHLRQRASWRVLAEGIAWALLGASLLAQPTQATTLQWLGGGSDKTINTTQADRCTLLVTPDIGTGQPDEIRIVWVGNGRLRAYSQFGQSSGPYHANVPATASELAAVACGVDTLDMGPGPGGSTVSYVVQLLSGTSFSLTAIEVRNHHPLKQPLASQPVATINQGVGSPCRPEAFGMVQTVLGDSAIFSVYGVGLASTYAVSLTASGAPTQAAAFAIQSDTALRVSMPKSSLGGARALRFASYSDAATLLPITGSPQLHQLLAVISQAYPNTILSSISGIVTQTPFSTAPDPLGGGTSGGDGLSRVLTLDIDSGTSLATVLAQVRAVAGVESADSLSSGVVPLDTPNDPFWSEQWELHPVTGLFCTGTIQPVASSSIDVLPAWVLPPFPSPVDVGIIDTGVDETHPETNYFNPDDRPDSFAPDGSLSGVDRAQHGTAVASIAAATTNNSVGLASASRQGGPVSVKWYGDNGSGSFGTIGQCITFAANAPHMPIVNISAGGKFIAPTEILALQRACKAALKADHFLVASAGNQHDSVFTYPAALNPYVTAVGACLWNNNYWTHYNAWAPTNDSLNGTTFGSWVDISAPGGVGITAARPGQRIPAGTGPGMFEINGVDPITRCDLRYLAFGNIDHIAFSGTSASAPFVAGAAAWLKLVKPALHAEDLSQVLLRTATDMGAVGFDVMFGNGRLSVASATRYVLDNWFEQGAIGGGTSTPLDMLGDSASTTITITNGSIGGTALNGTYPCVRYHLAKLVYFTGDFEQAPTVWIRRAGSVGISAASSWNDAADVSWAGIGVVHPEYTIFDTYVYRLTSLGNLFYPAYTTDARIEYTAVGHSHTLGVPGDSRGTLGSIQLYPLTNPARGVVALLGTRIATGPVRVEVYDPLGRRLRKLFEGPGSADGMRFVWDGRDERGVACNPGMYLCRIEQFGRQAACRFALVR